MGQLYKKSSKPTTITITPTQISNMKLIAVFATFTALVSAGRLPQVGCGWLNQQTSQKLIIDDELINRLVAGNAQNKLESKLAEQNIELNLDENIETVKNKMA